MTIFALLLVLSHVFLTCGQQPDGDFVGSGASTIVLTGQPRLISRTIWRERMLNDARPNVQGRQPQFQFNDVGQNVQGRGLYHVNLIHEQEFRGPLEGARVIVHRRLLRPAKLVYTGGDTVTDQWTDIEPHSGPVYRMPPAVQHTGRQLFRMQPPSDLIMSDGGEEHFRSAALQQDIGRQVFRMPQSEQGTGRRLSRTPAAFLEHLLRTRHH